MQALIIAWNDYLYTGDLRPIETHYELLKSRTLLALRRGDGQRHHAPAGRRQAARPGMRTDLHISADLVAAARRSDRADHSRQREGDSRPHPGVLQASGLRTAQHGGPGRSTCTRRASRSRCNGQRRAWSATELGFVDAGEIASGDYEFEVKYRPAASSQEASCEKGSDI